jgi:hypothetical protein
MKRTTNVIADIAAARCPEAEHGGVGGECPAHVTPAYLPSGGTVSIVTADPNNGGRVMLALPGVERNKSNETLAIEVSTKPFINLVWLGAVVMLASAFMSMIRRVLDMKREKAAA